MLTLKYLTQCLVENARRAINISALVFLLFSNSSFRGFAAADVSLFGSRKEHFSLKVFYICWGPPGQVLKQVLGGRIRGVARKAEENKPRLVIFATVS